MTNNEKLENCWLSDFFPSSSSFSDESFWNKVWMRTNNTVSAVLRQKFARSLLTEVLPGMGYKFKVQLWDLDKYMYHLEYWQILCKLHLGLQSIYCEWQGEIIGPWSNRKRLKTGWPLDMVKEQVVMVLATCTTVSCQSKKPQSQHHHGEFYTALLGFVLSNLDTYIKVNIIWNKTRGKLCRSL